MSKTDTSCTSFRAACLQNETAPKSFNFKTKNGPKNDPKLPRKFLSLVLLCRISHRHYSKIFNREFPHKIKYFFTTRICRHGHANFVDVSDIFYFFFCSGEGKGESEAPGGARGDFNWKSQDGEVSRAGGGGGARGWEGVCVEFGEGG